MSESASRSRAVAAALAGALALIAILILLLRTSMPLASARSTVDYFSASLASRNVEAIRSASTPDFYQGLLESLSRRRYERARSVYQEVIPQLAAEQWLSYRQKANLLAVQEYERLRLRVDELGRVEFAQLSGDERMRLIDGNGFDRFVITAGLRALPEPDRRGAGDPTTFATREGRNDFVARRAWDLLPEADRALLGSAEALSTEETAAKLAFFDKVALPQLGEEDRRLASRFARPAVASLSTFARTHGAELAKEILASVTMQAPSRADCRYAETDAGSILWPSVASCDVAIAINGNAIRLHLEPVKAAGSWRVQSASSELALALAP